MTAQMLDGGADKAPPKRGKRAKFVKMNVAAREELRERLWTLRGTETRADRAVDVGVDVAYATASWTFDLLADADWATGVVGLSDSALAVRYGLGRNTVKRRADLLAWAGVLVGEAGQRRFTEDAMAWLRDGQHPPMDEVTAGLMRHAAARRVLVEGVDQGAVPAHQRAVPAHQRAVPAHQRAEGAHQRAVADPVDNAAQPISTGAQAPEVVSEASVDVIDGKTYQTGSVVDDALEKLNDVMPGSRDSKRLHEECRRLVDDLGWTAAEIVSHLGRECTNAQGPGLYVHALAEITHRPQRAPGPVAFCGECDDGWITDDITRKPLRKCDCRSKSKASRGGSGWQQTA